MSIKITIYREALLSKGIAKSGHIHKAPEYRHVCFNHAILLAGQGVRIIEELDSEHDDYYLGDDRCVICKNKVSVADFVRSAFDLEPEYDEEVA